ncbi:hypothetical protein [Magnetospirillum gryphiswaldense]|nr:hypothetical protein [Magnetospirillum gryphiswaldense]
MNLLSVYGSVASLAGLAITFREQGKPFSSLELALYIVAGMLTLLWSIMAFRSYYKNRPHSCRTEKQILKYMLKWISHPGRAVIFTRDMSWTNNDDVKSVLLKKAAANELTIILEHDIPLADELRAEGAKIVTYAGLRHTPASRFTIINKDRHDAQVAVGGKVDGQHVIHEFQQGHHPFFAVANDLADILIKLDVMSQDKVKEHALPTC